MTSPVLNLQSALARVKNGYCYLIPPWNSFFQQFTQPAPAIVNVGVTASPFTANAKGSIIIQGATTITLTRGLASIDLTGQQIIPISINDTISWTGIPTLIRFLGA